MGSCALVGVLRGLTIFLEQLLYLVENQAQVDNSSRTEVLEIFALMLWLMFDHK